MSASSSRDGTETDWLSIVAVTLGITAFAMAQGLTYPLLSFLLSDRGASDLAIGLHAAAFMLGLAASVVLLPHQNRRHRAGVLIVAGLLGAAATLICFALTENPWLWFILRFCLGYCVNTIYVLGEAWLNAAASDRVRGRVAGVYGAGMSTGFALGPLGIPAFGTQGGLAFAVCASMVALVAFAFAILARRARVEPEPVVLREVLSFFRLAPHLLLLVVVFGVMDSTTIAVIPVHLTEEGLTQEAAAVFVTVLHVGMIAAQPGLGSLLDRFDRWRVARLCLVLTGISVAALIYVPLEGWAIWVLAAVVGAAFFGTYTSALALLGQDHRGGALTAGSAAFALCYSIGGVAGPTTTGFLMEIDPAMAFWALAGVNFAAAAWLIRWRQWLRRQA